MIAYKLFRVRKDGTLGSLFINRADTIPVGKWVRSKLHRTEGFLPRQGWHCCAAPFAPHLSMKGRKWFKIEIKTATKHKRPEHQGGLWFTADWMMVIEAVDPNTVQSLSHSDPSQPSSSATR